MRSLVFSLLTLVLVSGARVATAQSCCAQDKGWIAMASTREFAAAHEAPLPLSFVQNERASMIRFETLDSKEGQAYYVPSDQPTTRVLLMFHEWWGLNDYIKREAERWQKMLGNVDVYAVDMYDGQIAATPEEAGKLSKGLDAKRGETIIKGLLAKVGRNKEIATIGWCMGGSWSFTATLLAEQQAVGAVMYYGFPEQDKKRIQNLQADVLYVWASNDKFITREVVTEFQKNVEGTGHQFTWHTFEADHGFANPSNPKYAPEATEQAQVLSVNFLKEKLRLD
jgi:carboxymethylenebutenolidase